MAKITNLTVFSILPFCDGAT